jgi:hypothetical protein
MGIMSVDELIQAKLIRLEELKKYQSYYGPNTPLPIIAEINNLEAELQRMVRADKTRSTRVIKKKVVKKNKKNKVPFWQVWRLSGPTLDAIAVIAFIGLFFLFGVIVYAAYIKTRPPARHNPVASFLNPGIEILPTLRPTFTPTPGLNNLGVTTQGGPVDGSTYLPTPGEAPTEVPTPVPTLTPSATPPPTETLVPTDTPAPTSPPPAAPAPAAPRIAAPAAAAPPTSTPAPAAPAYPFTMVEQGNREFQRTNYHVITIYVAAVSAGNVPIGGLKIVGDHMPSGMHAESGPSDWNWSAVNCLECDYVKQGNLKFEPGTFADGVWNIYLADQNGAPLSEVFPLTYSADPAQWVWDFLIFRRNS